jgi:hypothetical protein
VVDFGRRGNHGSDSISRYLQNLFFYFCFGDLGGGDAARQPSPLGCAPERKYWINNVSRAIEEEGEFHIQFGSLKNEGQQFFKYFRMSIWKFEN